MGGPELFMFLDRPKNLTELSVSIKPKMAESATPVTSIQPLNDVSTKKFFRAIQQRLGRKLERLRMSFCSIVWQRPSQTACSLARCLLRCEKLVDLEFNFVRFSIVADTVATSSKIPSPNAAQGDPIHWFANAVIAGCPQLKELSLIGTTLTVTQAYNLGLQIRDRWNGDFLRIHMWRTSNDEHQPTQIIFNLLHAFKNDNKFEADYIGGYRGTVAIRRRKHLCGLVSRFRHLKIGFPKLLPYFCPNSKHFFRTASTTNFSEESGMEPDNIEELCSSLPPGLRSLFGLTPFDYSIMLAHNWVSIE